MLGKALRDSVSPPKANAPEKLRSYWIKIITFLSDVQGSSAGLTRASTLRSSHPLWNASAQNKGEVCPVLEVGRYETVCHTGTSLDGYKSYRHFRPAKYHTGTPQ